MIRAESVSKHFGSVRALHDVSFALQANEIVGFLGPNGAGKSTLMRLIATYLPVTAGRITVMDLDTAVDPLAVRTRIGYLPGDAPSYADMRVDRHLAFCAEAHGLRGSARKARLEAVVDALRLESALPKRVKQCSTGFRKRIGLAAALIHDPPVLLLDEPTHGLDPLQVLAFRELLRSLRPGRTILLSSHIVAEVAQLADRVLLLHDGRLLGDGNVQDLCRAAGLAANDLEGLFVQRVREHEQKKTEVAHGR
jgi:ABC-2 type transport system ATP-binding protein